MPTIKAIFGLGNPGQEHSKNRHNVGAILLQRIAQKYDAPLNVQSKFDAVLASANISGQEVKLAVPTTYMNLSGKAVAKINNFFKINPDEILVIHDELDLPCGTVRLKIGGGTAGHNGLKDIKQKIGNINFPRIRLGIGHPGKASMVSNYVLSDPSIDEEVMLELAYDKAIKHIDDIIMGEFDKVMRDMNS